MPNYGMSTCYYLEVVLNPGLHSLMNLFIYLLGLQTKFSCGMIQFVPDGRNAACSKLQALQTRQKFWRWLAFYLRFTTLSLCHMYSLIGDEFHHVNYSSSISVYVADW